MKKELLVSALLVGCLSTAAWVQAKDQDDKVYVYAYSINKREAKFDKENREWLRPGWAAPILAGVDDSGNAASSVSLFMEKDGLVVCSSTENQSDNVITAPVHCNGRMTLPGFHIPPEEIFKGESEIKHWGKVIGAAIPLALATGSWGAASSGSAIVTSIIPLDPAGVYSASRELRRSGKRLAQIATDNAQRQDGIIPEANMDFRIQDLIPALNQEIKRREKKCLDLTTPKVEVDSSGKQKFVYEHSSDPEYAYCHRQEGNVAREVTIGAVCSIPMQPAQVGEPGQADLWRPGQPLPAGCADLLKAYDVKRAANGHLRFFDQDESSKDPEAGAIDPDTKKPITAGKRLLNWERRLQVNEWIAENATTDDGQKAALANLLDYQSGDGSKLDWSSCKNGTLLDTCPGQSLYQWLLFLDPSQADPVPAPAVSTPAATAAAQQDLVLFC